MPIGLKGNSDGSGAIQIGGSDAISISTGLNTTFAGTITATGTVAGTTGTLYPIVAATAVSATGTAVDFTGIPSWVRRITVMFSGLSTNGTSSPQIQIGTSGGVQATGYLMTTVVLSTGTPTAANATTGFVVSPTGNWNSTVAVGGAAVFSLLDSSTGTWVCVGSLGRSDAATQWQFFGSKALSGTLDRVRVTTVNGTDAFDAGSVNILYE
jgi:hypothetical protein